MVVRGGNSDEKEAFSLQGVEVPQVLFRLSRWENLEYAKKI